MALNHERRNRQQRRHQDTADGWARQAHARAISHSFFATRLPQLVPKKRDGKKQTVEEFLTAGGKITKV